MCERGVGEFGHLPKLRTLRSMFTMLAFSVKNNWGFGKYVSNLTPTAIFSPPSTTGNLRLRYLRGAENRKNRLLCHTRNPLPCTTNVQLTY